MERIKKILFLFAITLTCVFGISGVKAENFSDTVIVTANEGWWIHPHVSLIKKTSDDKYVFCLDSGKQVDLNVPLNYNEKLYADKLESVNRIINKSISLGLGSSNQWRIPDTDFYGITQIAIWKAVHGDGAAGYTSTYESWIGTRYSDVLNIKYSDVLNILFNAVDEPMAEPSISFQGTEGMSVDGNYLVSNEFKIVTSNVDPNAILTFSINDGEVSINDIWVKKDFNIKSGDIKSGDVIKFRVRKPSTGSGNISVSASVKTSEFNYGYDTYFYGAKTSGYQNIAAYYPRSTSVSDSITVSGSYENVELEVSKTDATNQKEIGGATMYVYDLDGNEFTHWTSEEGKNHLIKGLIIDKIYRLQETVAPTGYDKLTNDIYFKVNSNGRVTTCKADVVKPNDTCEAMSTEEILNIKNYPSKTDVKTGKVVISKKDFTNDNQEVIGAHLQILDENGNIVASWESDGQLHEFELAVGKYTLVETIPAPNYDADMYIIGNPTSSYEFEITEDGVKKIDVYNKLKATKIDVPITGMSVTSLYVIGGLVTLAGASVVVYAKKKENM